MINKRYITVLDFTYGEVFQYEIPKVFAGGIPWKHEDFEEFLRDLGHSIGNIEWMEHGPSQISGPHINFERHSYEKKYNK